MASAPDILIVGFGAIGALYGFILAKTGQCRITVASRSNHAILGGRGMHFRSAKHGDHDNWKPFRAFASVEEALDRAYAYVVVATKAIPELQKTSALLSPLLSKQYLEMYPCPVYVLMQNGLNVEVDLYQALKRVEGSSEPQIISTAVWAFANMLEGGVVQHYDLDRITIGMYRETLVNLNTAQETAILDDFAGLLRKGGCDVMIVPEIQRIKYSKNLWSATFGIVSAITRLHTDTIFLAPQTDSSAGNNPTDYVKEASATLPETASYAKTALLKSASPAMSLYTIPFVHDAMDELRQLGTLLFPPSGEDPGLDPDIVTKLLAGTAEMWGSGKLNHRVSLLLDVENGRPTEVEVILGELVRLARRRNLILPRIEGLYALMLLIQSQLLLQHHRGVAAV